MKPEPESKVSVRRVVDCPAEGETSSSSARARGGGPLCRGRSKIEGAVTGRSRHHRAVASPKGEHRRGGNQHASSRQRPKRGYLLLRFSCCRLTQDSTLLGTKSPFTDCVPRPHAPCAKRRIKPSEISHRTPLPPRSKHLHPAGRASRPPSLLAPPVSAPARMPSPSPDRPPSRVPCPLTRKAKPTRTHTHTSAYAIAGIFA